MSFSSIFCCAGQHTWFADCRRSPLATSKTSLAAVGVGVSNSGTAYVAIAFLLQISSRLSKPLAEHCGQ
jgi:hypothetical protein